MNTPADRLREALADKYRLDREIGQGGMATVYLAQDLKHDRQVALKVLRPELAATLGPARFFREIQVAARLQHPHILPLHDSGEAGGFLYYVMPYVEGESLRERLARVGELPIHDAVKILMEVVDALAYAHGQGVVHRDIKPDNVMLSGRHALVTDFGVAKAVSEATGKNQLTTAGVALGTPSYMAPEQAAADPHLDHRVDIYAVGAMAYELLTGRPPFTGMTAQQVLAAHVTQAPDPVSRHRAAVTPALEAVVMRCLAKRAADRWQTAEELLQNLEPLATPSGGMTPTHTQPVRGVSLSVGSRKSQVVLGAVLLLVLSGLGWLVLHRGTTHRLAVVDQRQLTFTGRAFSPAISPDGKWLAYLSADSGLMVQEIGGGRAISVLAGAFFRIPIWSPDGGSLLVGATLGAGFTDDGTWEVPRLGGEPKRLGGNAYSYDYSPDGKRTAWAVFDTIGITDRATGREIQRRAIPGLSDVTSLRWSPDSGWLALAGSTVRNGTAVYLLHPGDSTLHLVSHLNGPLAWARDGAALYILTDSRIVRQRIDPRTGVPVDSGETVLTGVGDASEFSLGGDGHTLALGRGQSNSQIVTLMTPRSGSALSAATVQLSSGTAVVGNPAVSPDGQWVAWPELSGRSLSVMVKPFAGGPSRTIGRYGSSTMGAVQWSPDSRTLAYTVGDSTPRDLYTAAIDGSAPSRIGVIHNPLRGVGWAWIWARQGLIVPDSTQRGYLLIDPATGHARPLAQMDSVDRSYSPLLSPDGKIMIVGRWRPYGFANDLWQRRLDGGAWQRMRFVPPNTTDPYPLRWDESGLYVAVQFYLRAVKWEIWRSSSPDAPLVPLLTGIRPCRAAVVPSVSVDGRHLACIQTTATSDAWIATNFDTEAQ